MGNHGYTLATQKAGSRRSSTRGAHEHGGNTGKGLLQFWRKEERWDHRQTYFSDGYDRKDWHTSFRALKICLIILLKGGRGRGTTEGRTD